MHDGVAHPRGELLGERVARAQHQHPPALPRRLDGPRHVVEVPGVGHRYAVDVTNGQPRPAQGGLARTQPRKLPARLARRSARQGRDVGDAIETDALVGDASRHLGQRVGLVEHDGVHPPPNPAGSFAAFFSPFARTEGLARVGRCCDGGRRRRARSWGTHHEPDLFPFWPSSIHSGLLQSIVSNSRNAGGGRLCVGARPLPVAA